jgi:hypothetical protein
MPIAVAHVLALVVYAYLGLGGLFAVAVLPRRVLRLDPGLAGAPLAVRLLIAPGTVLLWPLLAHRWFIAPRRQGGHA